MTVGVVDPRENAIRSPNLLDSRGLIDAKDLARVGHPMIIAESNQAVESGTTGSRLAAKGRYRHGPWPGMQGMWGTRCSHLFGLRVNGETDGHLGPEGPRTAERVALQLLLDGDSGYQLPRDTEHPSDVTVGCPLFLTRNEERNPELVPGGLELLDSLGDLLTLGRYVRSLPRGDGRFPFLKASPDSGHLSLIPLQSLTKHRRGGVHVVYS